MMVPFIPQRMYTNAEAFSMESSFRIRTGLLSPDRPKQAEAAVGSVLFKGSTSQLSQEISHHKPVLANGCCWFTAHLEITTNSMHLAVLSRSCIFCTVSSILLLLTLIVV